MFKVYDIVWVIEHNNICKKRVNSVIQIASFGKNNIDIEYGLVNCMVAGSTSKGNVYQEARVFATKSDLIKNLE